MRKLSKDGFSSNIDVNEAGLDALIQSAVCEDIGWREGTRKMIVYASDAGFHSQGNGLHRTYVVNSSFFDVKMVNLLLICLYID